MPDHCCCRGVQNRSVVWALICVNCEHHQCQLELDLVHHSSATPSGLDARDRSGTSQGRDVQLRSAPAKEVQWWPAADHSEYHSSSLVS